MNEIPQWLPDWRNEKAYPDKHTTSDIQWAWEFLRRNPKYIATYGQLRKRLTEFKSLERKLDNDLPDEMLEAAYAQINFGTWEIVNPANSFNEATEEALVGPEQDSVKFGSSDSSKDMVHLWLPEIAAAVRFSLAENLEAQWKKAKSLLKKRISELRAAGKLSKPKYAKRHRNNFVFYLRVLDANVAGARPSEIAKELLKVKKATSEAVTRISKYRNAALRYRDEDYKFLVANL